MRRIIHFSWLIFLCHSQLVTHAFHSPQPIKLSFRRKATADDFVENRGDARGAALLLEDVSVFRGPNEILNQISWRVEPNTKWALVGPNGAGKSTLLSAIVGQATFDGKVTIGHTQSVGYLRQTAVAGSKKTIYEEACSGMTDILAAQRDMEEAMEKADMDALEEATTRFEAAGGYQQEAKVSSVLKGLGFSNLEQKCDELSGGWQMRVALAKLLLSEPSFCLMDEPSNHLDAAAQKWLARYLSSYDKGSLILVTHNVDLLRSMDHIAEVSSRKLQIYKSCTYDQYLALKAERADAAKNAYERNMEKAAKLQSFVDRFGASATKASAAQSRVKQIERMEREGLLDAPAEEIIAERFKPILNLPDPPKSIGHSLLTLRDAKVGYEGKELIHGVNLEITRGMKLLIRGPNGAGKSTILHTLRGTNPLLGGERIENDTLRLGMFTQDLAQELDPSQRAVDIVTQYARGEGGNIMISDQQARTVMGGLGLTGEKSLRKLGDLSGGEKARVALAMFALKPSNVYLMDEVSNHLDVECVEALGDALRDWGEETGALLVVSHDREFCNKIEFTHVATVSDGKFVMEQRSARESDWAINDMEAAATSRESIHEKKESKKPDLDPALRKQAFNAPKRIAKLEKMIEETEGKIAALEEEMLANGSDTGKLMDLSKKKENLEATVEKYTKEWEELEQLLLQIA